MRSRFSETSYEPANTRSSYSRSLTHRSISRAVCTLTLCSSPVIFAASERSFCRYEIQPVVTEGMSVASNAKTSILLRMLSSRSARSSPETACSHEGTRCSLEVRLVRRGTVHGGDGGAGEPQVHGQLAAMMHEVIEHRAPVHGELGVRGDGPTPDLERPRLLELRIRGLGEDGPRRGRV